MFYKQNKGIRFSAVCLYVFITKWKFISSQGLIIYSPPLNVICSNFFFNGEGKAPSCSFEQVETEGHLGAALGLLGVTGWPLCFVMEGAWAPIFQGGLL